MVHLRVGRLCVWLAIAVLVQLFASSALSAQSRERSGRGARPVQVGFATYYANSFDGDRTASGERFDQDTLVAAHRTYPFGTRIRVTNLENRRSVLLRVVDRGPYGGSRRHRAIVDVSRAAARRLGMIRDGRVRVRVEVLEFGRGRTLMARRGAGV
jgi:rare lipoprotein A